MVKKWLLNNGAIILTILLAVVAFARRAGNNEQIIQRNVQEIRRLDDQKLDKVLFEQQYRLKQQQQQQQQSDNDHRFEAIQGQLDDLKSSVKELRAGQIQILRVLRR